MFRGGRKKLFEAVQYRLGLLLLLLTDKPTNVMDAGAVQGFPTFTSMKVV
ncbi:hypothetical protein Tco_1004563, partial [Tanacetum coccineum]